MADLTSSPCICYPVLVQRDPESRQETIENSRWERERKLSFQDLTTFVFIHFLDNLHRNLLYMLMRLLQLLSSDPFSKRNASLYLQSLSRPLSTAASPIQRNKGLFPISFFFLNGWVLNLSLREPLCRNYRNDRPYEQYAFDERRDKLPFPVYALLLMDLKDMKLAHSS